jgi:hypothetical protein
LLAEVHAQAKVSTWPIWPVGDVFLMASERPSLTPRESVAVVGSYLAHLVETGDYADGTAIKACALMSRFVAYTTSRFGSMDVRKLGPAHVTAFINAPILKDEEVRHAAERTKENRYWALDLYFRTLRGLDLYDGDPLLDAERYPRIVTDCRPLVDAEIERCRRFTFRRLNSTLGPVRWALAESMATAAEIQAAVVGDYDRSARRFWLNGTGRRLHHRWVNLLPWALEAVERRIASLGGDSLDPMTSLAFDGAGSRSGEAAVSITLRRALDRAGLTRQAHPMVKPKSARAWGARRLYDETGDITEVAHRLGVIRLDTARQIIQLPAFPPDDPPPHRRPV